MKRAQKNWISFNEIEAKLLADPETKRLYDEMEPEFAIIDQLIEARIKNNLTQKEIAEKMGTKQSAIARLEGGRANPSIKFLQRFAAAIGKTLVISFV